MCTKVIALANQTINYICRYLEKLYMPSTEYQTHPFQRTLLQTQNLFFSKLQQARTSHMRLGKYILQWRIQRGFPRYPLPPPPPFFNIIWKWNNLISLRRNRFIFMGYLRKKRDKISQANPQLYTSDHPFQKSWTRPVLLHILFYSKWLTWNITQSTTYKCMRMQKLLYGLSVYTGDSPLAKSRGLVSHTDAQTIQWLTGTGMVMYWYVYYTVFDITRACICSYNYNCRNIYWDPLIWLVENGHLIALICISFFNEPGPYSWGAGPFRGPFMSELLLWYCAMLLWREMDSLRLLTVYLTLTPIFSGDLR